MSATIYFVRHGKHELQDRILVGRMSGVALSREGKEQVAHLAGHFAAIGDLVVHSSPSERARDTAMPIASGASVDLAISSDIDEVDFGAWTGKSFADLARDRHWAEWNAKRSQTCPPGGETMRALQCRVLRHIERCCAAHPEGRIVLVTHAEVIRAALLHWLDLPAEAFGQVPIEPASISTVKVGRGGARVVAINEVPH